VCPLLLAPLAVSSIYTCNTACYDMRLGENCVRVFYGTEKRVFEYNSESPKRSIRISEEVYEVEVLQV